MIVIKAASTPEVIFTTYWLDVSAAGTKIINAEKRKACYWQRSVNPMI